MSRSIGSERRRRLLRSLCVAQVVFGCLAVVVGVRSGGLWLPVIGALAISWVWVPLACSARDTRRVRARLWYGMLAALAALAIGLVVVRALIPHVAEWVVPAAGIVGVVFLVLPLLIAWVMAREPTTSDLARRRAWSRTRGGEQRVDGLRLAVDAASDPDAVVVAIDVEDPRFLGQSASLEVYRLALVDDRSPVNDLRILASRDVTLDAESIEVRFPAAQVDGCGYRGARVTVRTWAELRIDDGVLWETTVRADVPLPERRAPAAVADAAGIVDPSDRFSAIATVATLPPLRRLAAVALFVGGVGLVTANTFLAIHDQRVPPGGHILYPRRDDAGDAIAPLALSLLVSVPAAVGVWFGLRWIVRNALRFRPGSVPQPIGRDTVVPLATLVQGAPDFDVDDLVVRVVACNLEKGAYTRGSGTSERTISFADPVRAIVLHEQVLAHVPRGMRLEHVLAGSVAFAPVFDLLEPPIEVSKTHGLFLEWRVQILHDALVDQELVPESCVWREADFAGGRSGGAAPAGG